VAEPTSELLVHHTTNVSLRLACTQSREDGSNLGLVFVGVLLEVDADGIPAKEDLRDELEELTVSLSNLGPFGSDFLNFAVVHEPQSSSL
jgi:hypothetical protein